MTSLAKIAQKFTELENEINMFIAQVEDSVDVNFIQGFLSNRTLSTFKDPQLIEADLINAYIDYTVKERLGDITPMSRCLSVDPIKMKSMNLFQKINYINEEYSKVKSNLLSANNTKSLYTRDKDSLIFTDNEIFFDHYGQSDVRLRLLNSILTKEFNYRIDPIYKSHIIAKSKIIDSLSFTYEPDRVIISKITKVKADNE